MEAVETLKIVNSSNALTAYCFLSALTENQNDLYRNVYIPICKRALSYFSNQGNTGGKVSEIKEIIYNEYGIDVPERIVQRLIRAIHDNLSRKEKLSSGFKIFENGKSFQFNKYFFSDLEDKYRQGERDANLIQIAFQEFLESEETGQEVVPSFVEFLNRNKNALASYFKGAPEPSDEVMETTFLPHVRFLEKISNSHHSLYKIAESLYLGSIVAGFLESGMDLDVKFSDGETYYVDTPLILSALDLNKEAETNPARELLNLIISNGGQLKVLSITVDEVSGILKRAIQNYNNKVPTSDVNEACLRTGKKKSDLISIEGKILETLQKELSVSYEHYPEILIEKHQKSDDIRALKEQRINKGSAIHDVLAYKFVRERRGPTVSIYQKAKIWFLTSNKELYNFVAGKSTFGHVAEIALPDALTSMLWLKNPGKNIAKVKSIGLSSLMAHTIGEEIAGPDLINEFAEQLKSIESFSKDDYEILLKSVAHESAKNIERLVRMGVKDPNKQKIEAHRLLNKERARRNADFENLKSTQKVIHETKIENQELEQERDRFRERAEASEQLLQREQVERKLAQNQLRKSKRDSFVRTKIIAWRARAIAAGMAGPIVLFFIILYIYKENHGNMALTNDYFSGLKGNIFVSFSLALAAIIYSGVFIKIISDRYNKSTTKAFIDLLTIPEDLKELK